MPTARQDTLPPKSARLQNGDDAFFALLRNYGQLDLACQDIEHRLRRLSLRKDNLPLRKGQIRFTAADLLEERLRIKPRLGFGFHNLPVSFLRALR